MPLSIRDLLAVQQIDAGPIGLFIIALGIIAVGVFLILTPAQHLLKSDRTMASWLYRQELKASGDEQRAIAAGALFYRLIGACIVGLGAVFFLAGLFSLFSHGANT